MSFNWKIPAAVIAVLIIIGGMAFYLFQPQSQEPMIAETPTELPTGPEAGDIMNVLIRLGDAYERRSPEDCAAFFTDDGIWKSGDIPAWKGTKQIEDGLEDYFETYPNATAYDYEITKMDIDGDKAIIYGKGKWKNNDIRVSYTEKIELVKVEGIWKIAKIVSEAE
jgi:uncharacterized protein (TIGR02246 family)